MPELPSPEWTVDQYLEWMRRPFEYLHFQWAEQDGEKPSWEHVCRSEFLETLDVREAELETVPQLRLLQMFITYVDEVYTEQERREYLLDEDQRKVILETLIAGHRQELATAASASDPAPQAFRWVTAAQRAHLAPLGEAWRERLLTMLDEHYDGWTQTTEANLVTWLDGWMPTILGRVPVAPPPPGTPASLEWVTDQQYKQLTALGDGWRDTLRGSLDQHYQGWRQTTATNLVTWLDGWMGTVLGRIPAAPPPPGTPASLEWVTAEQKSALAPLGDRWREVLRASLERNYPGWKQTTSANLVTWLDGWMPTVLAGARPAAEARPAQAVPKQQGATAQEASKRVLGEATQTVMAAVKVPDGVTEAELEEIVREVLQERLAARGGR